MCLITLKSVPGFYVMDLRKMDCFFLYRMLTDQGPVLPCISLKLLWRYMRTDTVTYQSLKQKKQDVN